MFERHWEIALEEEYIFKANVMGVEITSKYNFEEPINERARGCRDMLMGVERTSWETDADY